MPAIRAILVKDLKEQHELSQTKIADKLGITQPAVSQYLSSVRGNSEIKEALEKKDIIKHIHDFSDLIASEEISKSKMVEKYCEICDLMGKNEILCILHADDAPHLKDGDCDICLKSSDN